MLTFFAAAAILCVAAFIGFKILRFVASVVIKLALLLLVLGVAAYMMYRVV